MDPNYADGHIFYGHFLTALGRPEEGMIQSEKALELDPFNIFYHALHMVQLGFAGRFEEGIEWARKVVEASPTMPMPHIWLLVSSEREGRYSEALAEWKAFFAKLGNPEVADALEGGESKSEYRATLYRAAAILAAQSPTRFVKPIYAVLIYDQAGQLDQAFEWVEKAIEERDHDLAYFNVFPWTDNFRADPRFSEIVQRMNFPE